MFDKSGGVQRIQDPVEFHGPVSHFQSPKIFQLKISSSVTSPDISNVEVLVPNANAIINFVGGAENQTIKILGDGLTSVANNASIKTNTGALKVLATHKVYRFNFINGIWYEDA